MSRIRDWRLWLLGLSALVIALDRLTKDWVSKHIAEGDAITVIPGVFRISHVLNSGRCLQHVHRFAASRADALAADTVFAAGGSGGACRAAARSAAGFRSPHSRWRWCFGGAIGNVWDRIRYATVVDFLEVHIVHYHWPDFNIADSAIVIGGILLLLDSLRSSASATTGPAKTEAS